MGFGEMFMIEPAPMSTIDRLEDVDANARRRIAERLQTRLRSTVDPGVSLKSAMAAQSIHVSPQGDEFVIDQEDQANIIKPPAAQSRSGSGDPNQVENVDELFEMGSGVPAMRDGKLVYRTISPAALFGEFRKEAFTQQFEQTVTATLRDEMLDAYEEALDEVGREHPKT